MTRMVVKQPPSDARGAASPAIQREVVASPSQHVQLALVHALGPAHEIEPQPYLRLTYNIGPRYVIDATGPQGRQVFDCARHALIVIPADTNVIHHPGLPKPAGRAYVPARLATFRISRQLVADCAIGLGLPAAQSQLEHQVLSGDDVLRGLAQALVADLRAGCPDGAAAAERTAAALVSRVLVRQQRCGPTATQGALALVKEHVESRLHEPLALDQLAAVAGMSVFHFCRVFRTRLGVTPHQYILAQRIQRAKRLLWERGSADAAVTSVLDIALACGFASPSHFAAQFKRHTGCTPLQWARSDSARREGFH